MKDLAFLEYKEALFGMEHPTYYELQSSVNIMCMETMRLVAMGTSRI